MNANILRILMVLLSVVLSYCIVACEDDDDPPDDDDDQAPVIVYPDDSQKESGSDQTEACKKGFIDCNNGYDECAPLCSDDACRCQCSLEGYVCMLNLGCTEEYAKIYSRYTFCDEL